MDELVKGVDVEPVDQRGVEVDPVDQRGVDVEPVDWGRG